MNAIIQFAIIPLITGLLTTLIFVFVVNLIQDWKQHFEILIKTIGGIAGLGITLFSIYSGTQENLCLKQEKLATEIVELIPKISYIVNYEIGTGDICYPYNGDPPNKPLNEEMFKASEDLRTNSYLLMFKTQLFTQSEVVQATRNYANAIKDLKEYCKDVQSDELQRKKSTVNDAGGKLISALGTQIANCYK